jgi:hypothetical protein
VKVEKDGIWISDLENGRIARLERVLRGQQEQLPPIAGSVARLEGKVQCVIEAIPRFYIAINELMQLAWEAGECIGAFKEIQERYPLSDVAQNPFSNTWKLAAGIEPMNEAVPKGMDWALLLERNIAQAKVFCLVRNLIFTEFVKSSDLYEYVAHWKTKDANVSGDLCLRLLRDHHAEVRRLVDYFGATFMK